MADAFLGISAGRTANTRPHGELPRSWRGPIDPVRCFPISGGQQSGLHRPSRFSAGPASQPPESCPAMRTSRTRQFGRQPASARFGPARPPVRVFQSRAPMPPRLRSCRPCPKPPARSWSLPWRLGRPEARLLASPPRRLWRVGGRRGGFRGPVCAAARRGLRPESLADEAHRNRRCQGRPSRDSEMGMCHAVSFMPEECNSPAKAARPIHVRQFRTLERPRSANFARGRL
jgi:hypothetical protein